MSTTGRDIEAGGAFVRLWMKDEALRGGLAKAEQAVKAFGKAISAVGRMTVGMGAALTAAGGLTLGFLRSAVLAAAEFGTASGRFDSNSKAAAAFSDQLEILDNHLSALKVQIGLALIPALSGMLQAIIGLIAGAVKFIGKNKEVVVIVAILAAIVTAAGAAFIALGSAAILAGAMISAAIHIVNAAILLFKIMNPEILLISVVIGLVVAALALLPVWVALNVYLLYKLLDATTQGRAALGALGNALQPLGDRFRETWGGILAALQKGELGAALRIAWLGLKGEFFRIMRDIDVGFAQLLQNLMTKLTGFLGAGPMAKLSALLGAAGMGIGIGGVMPALQDPNKLRAGYDQLIGDIDNERRKLIEQMKAPGAGGAIPRLGLAAAGTFSGVGIRQALAVSDKAVDKIAANTERTADILDQIKDKVAGGLPLL